MKHPALDSKKTLMWHIFHWEKKTPGGLSRGSRAWFRLYNYLSYRVRHPIEWFDRNDQVIITSFLMAVAILYVYVVFYYLGGVVK